jgi:hypothetical protein
LNPLNCSYCGQISSQARLYGYFAKVITGYRPVLTAISGCIFFHLLGLTHWIRSSALSNRVISVYHGFEEAISIANLQISENGKKKNMHTLLSVKYYKTLCQVL